RLLRLRVPVVHRGHDVPGVGHRAEHVRVPGHRAAALAALVPVRYRDRGADHQSRGRTDQVAAGATIPGPENGQWDYAWLLNDKRCVTPAAHRFAMPNTFPGPYLRAPCIVTSLALKIIRTNRLERAFPWPAKSRYISSTIWTAVAARRL